MFRLPLLPLLALGLTTTAAAPYENLARRDDTTVTSQTVGAEQLARLRDGSLESAMLARGLVGTELTFTLAEPREIDHLVIHTPGGPDWSIARKILIVADGETVTEIEPPNHFRHAARFDLKRRLKTLMLKIRDAHTASPLDLGSVKRVQPWGGFAEIELNAATGPDDPSQIAVCDFRQDNCGWYPVEKVNMEFTPGNLTFHGKTQGNRIAILTPGFETPGGAEYRVTAGIKGSPSQLQLALFEDTPQKKYVTTLNAAGLSAGPGNETHELAGTFRIPSGRGPLTGMLQLNAATPGEVRVTLEHVTVTRVDNEENAQIKLPKKWKFQFDRWSKLGDYSWTTPECDDSGWSDIDVPGSVVTAGHSHYFGIYRCRTAVEMQKPADGGPAYRLRVGKISSDDKTFFNGVQVGATFGIGSGQELRPEYPIPAELVRNGRNVIAVEVSSGFKNGSGIYAGPLTLTPFGNQEYLIQITAPDHEGNLFLKGEPVRLRFDILSGARPAAATPKLTWQIRDYYNRPVAAGERFVELAPGGGSADLELELPQTGYYSLEARLSDGGRQLTERKSSLGVLYDLSGPRGPLENSPFGINLGAAVQRKTTWFDDFPLLAKAGIDHVRIDINWDIVENEQGKYDWTVADNYVAAAKKHHLRIFPIMITVPHWNTRKSAASETSEWNKIYYAPDDTAPWKKFIAAAAARYRGEITEYEIWNEPNHGIGGGFWRGTPEKLCELVRLAYEAIKAADPAAAVIAPGMAMTDPNYVRTMGRFGALNYLDAISYHPYRHNVTPESPDNTLAAWDLSAGAGTPYFERDELLRAMREFQIDKPLYSTEFGWAIRGSNMLTVTPEQQAEYLVRYHAMMIPSIKRLFWYEFRNRVNGEENMAICHADKTPLPAYVAFNVMVHFLRDAKFTGEEIANSLYRIGYEKNGHPVGVLWSTAADCGIVLKTREEVAIYDIMGVETRRIPAGEIAALTVGGSPCYVTGDFELLPVASVQPAMVTLRPGATTEFELELNNPLSSELAGKLLVSGAPGIKLELPGQSEFFRLAPGAGKTLRGRLCADPAASLGNRAIDFAFEFNDGWQINSATARIAVKTEFPPTEQSGYLRTWLVAGPFAAPQLLAGGPGEEAGLNPVAGERIGECVWSRYTPELRKASNAYPPPEAVDFRAAGIRADRSIAYAFVRIKSPSDQSCILRVGSDDGIAAWVNGKEVFRHEAVRSVKADEDAVPIRLHSGWNTLLLKVSNGGLDWCFIARLTTLQGTEPADLTFSVEKPVTE